MNTTDFKKRNPVLVLFWGFGLFLLTQIVLSIGAYGAFFYTGEDLANLAKMQMTNPLTVLFLGLYALFIGIPATWLIVKYLWRRNIDFMVLRFDMKLLWQGVLFGIILSILIMLVLFLFGNAHITGYPGRLSGIHILESLVGYWGLMMLVGFNEEILFRGMFTREWATRWGWLAATIVGGLIFGAVHIMNVGEISVATDLWISAAGLLIGSLLVALMVRGKSLWLPIGFHAGWNFSLTALLGTTMSGLPSNLGLFQIDLTGNILLTGGKFGIELSFVTFVFTIAAIVLVLRYPFSRRITYLESRPAEPAPEVDVSQPEGTEN